MEIGVESAPVSKLSNLFYRLNSEYIQRRQSNIRTFLDEKFEKESYIFDNYNNYFSSFFFLFFFKFILQQIKCIFPMFISIFNLQGPDRLGIQLPDLVRPGP